MESNEVFYNAEARDVFMKLQVAISMREKNND